MKKNLLKLVTGIFLIALSFNANAQIDVGGGLSIFSDNVTNLALQGRAQFGITESIRVAPSFNFIFGDFSGTEINGDLHYLFNVTESVTVYPLAGLGLTSGGGRSNLGLNLGGGANFGITETLKIFAELKTVLLIDFYSPIVIGGGVLYTIGG